MLQFTPLHAIPEGHKECLSGDKCIHPSGPILPLDQFYKHPGTIDKREPRCKACKRVQQKQYRQSYTRTDRTEGAHIGETLALKLMSSIGVYAVPARLSVHKFVDIIAWGCVKIEVKTSTVEADGRCQFNFTSQTYAGNDLHGDLTLLIPVKPDGSAVSYHLFPSDHPVFFKADGKRKRGVQYIPNPKKSRHAGGIRLTKDLMQSYQNAWHLLEAERLRYAHAVMTGEVVPIEDIAG